MSFRLPQKESERRSIANSISFEDDPGLTEQSHKDSADINFIMKRYEQTGLISGAKIPPQFGDFSGVDDYHSALNKVLEAESTFMELSAQVRKRFDNDPGKFMEFVEDPANAKELVDLGLASEVQAPDATLRDVVEAVKSTKTVTRKKSSESTDSED